MIRLPEIKTAELSTYGNFAKCHQAHFRVSRVGPGTRLTNEREWSCRSHRSSSSSGSYKQAGGFTKISGQNHESLNH